MAQSITATLFPFSPTHDNVLAIDLSLGALNNPGLLADVN